MTQIVLAGNNFPLSTILAGALSTFQNLIRTGNEKGILRSDWLRWRIYRQARTDSSHTYDESKAEAVYSIAPDFLAEAKYLYEQLVKRNNPKKSV